MAGHRPDTHYDPHEAAEAAADRAYADQVLEHDRFSGRDFEQYGPELHISSQAELAAHNHDVLLDPSTHAFQSADNHDVYFHENSNTIVIVDSDQIERSTCYRDSGKEHEFERLIGEENKAREEHGLGPVDVKQGGFEALYGTEKENTVEPEPHPEAPPEPHQTAEATASDGRTVEATREPLRDETRETEFPSPDANQTQQAAYDPSDSIFYGIDILGDSLAEIVSETSKEIGEILGDAGLDNSESRLRSDARYFARCVDDPERFPPLNEEMAELVKERRAYEETSRALRESQGGGELSDAARQWNMQDREHQYMDHQKSFSM